MLVDQTLVNDFRPAFFDLIVIDECHRGSSLVSIVSCIAFISIVRHNGAVEIVGE